jgi:hypothetical protein
MNMKDYDFVEIGTCYFDTLIGECSDFTVGISIEPIREYLQCLPNKQYVTKINAAVVAPKDMPADRIMDLYYVHPATVQQHNLQGWLTGCNTINKPHAMHTNYHPNVVLWFNTEDKSTLKTRNLLEEGLVQNMKVHCITFEELVNEFQIGKIGYLKTDTEGYDCVLIHSVLDYYQDKKDLAPSKIRFESNGLIPKEDIRQITERLVEFGYTVTPSETGDDTFAVKLP